MKKNLFLILKDFERKDLKISDPPRVAEICVMFDTDS
jgi:hypothetical protein